MRPLDDRKRMDTKQRDVTERIKKLQLDLEKAREYLVDGSNAGWQGFRPLFRAKLRNDKNCPPIETGSKMCLFQVASGRLEKAENSLDRLRVLHVQPNDVEQPNKRIEALPSVARRLIQGRNFVFTKLRPCKAAAHAKR